MSSEFEDLLNKIQAFSDARDWSQFHSIKNLIVAVAAEVGELAEVIQWKSDEEAAAYLILLDQPQHCWGCHSSAHLPQLIIGRRYLP